MKQEIKRYTLLILGLFVCALGSVCLLKSNLGLSPWDVLHQGVSKNTGITIGQASIILGVLITILDIILGQPIGLGTVLNFILIGLFVDLLLFIDIIPIGENIFFRIFEVLAGIFFYAYGTYLYMSQGMGCGPRDGLMQILTKRLNKPVGFIKNSIEIFAFVSGWLLGGKFGIATILTALLTGPLLQRIFKFYKIEVKKLHHRNIKEEFRHLEKLLRGFR